ncbi:MAG: hypothetical protein AB7D06_05840 [Pedobacter sp.]
MLRFRFIFPIIGLCLLTALDPISAAANQDGFALAVNLPQDPSPLHAGVGVLALLLAAIGWVRRCRRRKSS